MQLDAGISLLGSKHREKVLKLNRRLVPPTAHHYTWLYWSLPPDWPHICLCAEWCKAGEKALEKLSATPDALRDQPRCSGKEENDAGNIHDHRPQEDLVNALLELLAFNISIQAPYFSGIRRRQTSVEWRTWPGVWERQMGWRCTSQSSHAQRSHLSSLHPHGPGGLSQEPPAGSGLCSSQGHQAGGSSHAGPPAQLFTSFPLFVTDLLVWEQLLPSNFRFDSLGFSSLHLLMTCLQLLLLLL